LAAIFDVVLGAIPSLPIARVSAADFGHQSLQRKILFLAADSERKKAPLFRAEKKAVGSLGTEF
jgi:hypothetical protein